MTKIINTTTRISCKHELKTPRWIYTLSKSGKLHIDNERLQRLKKEWPDYKVNSYLHFI